MNELAIPRAARALAAPRFPAHPIAGLAGTSFRMNEIVYDVTEILTPVIRFDPVADISVVAKAIPSKLVDLPAPKRPKTSNAEHSFLIA